MFPFRFAKLAREGLGGLRGRGLFAAGLLWFSLLVLASLLLSIYAIHWIALPSLREGLLAARRDMIREQVNTAWSLVEGYRQRSEEGELPVAVAQERAMARLRALRYGESGDDYFWINDLQPRVLMHPYRGDLESQDVSRFEDPDGKRVFIEFSDIARQHGAGFSEYLWQSYDDPGNVVRKLSYVRLFEPWGWVIGTGMYTDDIQARIAGVANRVNVTLATVLAVIALLTGLALARALAVERAHRAALVNLSVSEAKFRGAFNQAFQFCGLMTPDGEVREVNETALAFAGIGAADVVGKPFWETPYWTHSEELQQRLKLAIERAAAGELDHFEATHIAADGSLRAIDCSIKPVVDARGQINLLIAEGRDITQRKKADEERAKLEAQLQQARKMEALGRLAGGIAHDFNNMLQAIMGYVSVLQMDFPEDAPIQKTLAEILRASTRAAELVKSLLTFSRARAAGQKSADVAATVGGTLEMLSRLLGEHIEVRFVCHDEAPVAHVDPGQIEQVLINLCVNARDAMPDGGRIAIEIDRVFLDAGYQAANPWMREGEYVRLSVSDTGEGMSPEVQERIFEPFFTTKEPGSGTGLGLATVYALVRQNGGLVHLYSELGKGSVFRVYLPASEGAPRQETEEQRLDRVIGDGQTILLAEDNDQVRAVAAALLLRAGYKVIEARDGVEAIERFQAAGGVVALAVLDVIMPGKNGPAVAQTLRQHQPSLPILFCSGFTATHLSPEFIALPATRLLQKPYSMHVFLKEVAELIALRHVEDTPDFSSSASL